MVPFNTAQTVTIPTAPIVTAPVTTPSSSPAPVNAVSPSFSIVQIADNASGNQALPQNTQNTAPQQSALPLPSRSGASNLATNSGQVSTTNFLAQIIGQENSVGTRTVLVQYEKLVYFSTVKYKPSNASKPQQQPSDVFSKFVAQQRNDQQVRVQQTVNNIAAQTSSSPSAATNNAQSLNVSGVIRISRAQPTVEEDIQAEEAAVNALSKMDSVESSATPTAAALLAASAYRNSSSRVETQAKSDIEPTISNVA